MSDQAKFLVQVRWVLNSLIGGADLEKVRRHLPHFEIDAGATGFSVKMRDAGKVSPTPPPPPAPPASKIPSELDLARAAAAASSSTSGSTTLAPVE